MFFNIWPSLAPSNMFRRLRGAELNERGLHFAILYNNPCMHLNVHNPSSTSTGTHVCQVHIFVVHVKCIINPNTIHTHTDRQNHQHDYGSTSITTCIEL